MHLVADQYMPINCQVKIAISKLVGPIGGDLEKRSALRPTIVVPSALFSIFSTISD